MKFLRLLVFLALATAALALYLFHVPFGPSRETFVDIPSGTGTAGIASRLQAAGIIRSRFAFAALRKVRGGTLKAGVYRFDHPASTSEIYSRLVRGDVFTVTLVIPEGFNLYDIAHTVEAAKLDTAPHFLASAQASTSLIRDYSPGATSLEGFLFPDTYRFSPHATSPQMLAAMVHRFRQQATELGLKASPDIAHTVTLASLVEKEVHLDAERPLVAGVFENRLKLGMPLATDPAVVYAALLEGKWRGTIYQSDLQRPSSYNTYLHPGLPPGPIANPGLAALRAALHPAKTDFLYFVAAPDGSTQFSSSLEEHNRQVAAWRAAQP